MQKLHLQIRDTVPSIHLVHPFACFFPGGAAGESGGNRKGTAEKRRSARQTATDVRLRAAETRSGAPEVGTGDGAERRRGRTTTEGRPERTGSAEATESGRRERARPEASPVDSPIGAGSQRRRWIVF